MVAVLVSVLVWGVQGGVCVDGHDAATSSCTTGPAIGVPAAVVVTAACAGLVALAVRRLVVLIPRSRRHGRA